MALQTWESVAGRLNELFAQREIILKELVLPQNFTFFRTENMSPEEV